MTPREEGRAAFLRGCPSDAGPYYPNDPRHDEWLNGWIMAERVSSYKPPSFDGPRDQRIKTWGD